MCVRASYCTVTCFVDLKSVTCSSLVMSNFMKSCFGSCSIEFLGVT